MPLLQLSVTFFRVKMDFIDDLNLFGMPIML